MKTTLLLIFCLLSLSLTGQNLPEHIDISNDFEKVSKYNQYIERANYYHYKAARRRGAGWIKFLIGAALAGGGLYLAENDISKDFEAAGESFEKDWETALQYGGMLGGLGMMLWGTTQSNDYHLQEIQELRRASQVFGGIYTRDKD